MWQGCWHVRQYVVSRQYKTLYQSPLCSRTSYIMLPTGLSKWYKSQSWLLNCDDINKALESICLHWTCSENDNGYVTAMAEEGLDLKGTLPPPLQPVCHCSTHLHCAGTLILHPLRTITNKGTHFSVIINSGQYISRWQCMPWSRMNDTGGCIMKFVFIYGNPTVSFVLFCFLNDRTQSVRGCVVMHIFFNAGSLSPCFSKC